MRQKNRGVKFVLFLLIFLFVGALLYYFYKVHKYVKPPDGWAESLSFTSPQPMLYVSDRVGISIRLPSGYRISPGTSIGGTWTKDYPQELQIVKDKNIVTCSQTECDMMNIKLFENNDSLVDFIRNVQTDPQTSGAHFRERKRTHLETIMFNGVEAQWFESTSLHEGDTSKDYEIYFANGKFCFILIAQATWLKLDILEILNGIHFTAP